MQIKSSRWKTVVQGNSVTYDVIVDISDTSGANVLHFDKLNIESLTVDRALTSDMPAGTRFSTGYPAAGANIGLSGFIKVGGAYTALDDYLNPWNAASAQYLVDWTLYRVVISVRIYVDNVPDATVVFTGTVDELSIDHNTGLVSFVCIDDRNKLRADPDLPIAYSDSTILPFSNNNIYVKTPLTSLYVVDYLFTKAGFSTSLPDRPNQILRVNNHGGPSPQSSVYGNVRSYASDELVAGKYFPQLCATNNTYIAGPGESPFYPNFPPVSGVDIGLGKALTFEAWVKNTGKPNPSFANSRPGVFGAISGQIGDPSTLSTATMFVGVQFIGGNLIPYAEWREAGNLFVAKVCNFPTLAIPADGNFHYVLVSAFTYPSGGTFYMQARAWVDGSPMSSQGVSLFGLTPVPASIPAWSFGIESAIPADSIQLTQEPDVTVVGSRAAYAPAIVPRYDPSLNNLTVIPETTGLDSWAVLQNVAEAEQAITGFDELGVPFFINRDTLRTNPVSREITSRSSLKTLVTRIAKSTVVSHVQIPVNGVAIGRDREAVWNTPDTIAIPAFATYSVMAVLAEPSVDVYSWGAPIPEGGVGPYPGGSWSGYRASYFASGESGITGGQAVTNLEMRVYPQSPTLVLVTVRNPNAATVYLVTPDTYSTGVGTPCLIVAARPAGATRATGTLVAVASGIAADAQWPPIEAGGAASGPMGDVLLPVQPNPFLQDAVSGQLLADDLLADLYLPRPILDNVAVIMDPSLQLADRVTIADPLRAKINDDAQVFSISLSLSKDDAVQALGMRTISTPGAWVMGVQGHSEMGVNTRV